MSRRRRHRARSGGRRLLRWTLRLVLLAILWLLGVAGWIVYVGQRDQARAADAIVVLGAAAYHVRPSPVFAERIRHGVDLYRRGFAPVLIFTGGYGDGARYSEAEVAARFARREGVPDSAILIETLSRTTRENLEQAAALMRQRELRQAILVSDPLHMARALRQSGQVGLQAVGSPTPTSRFRSPGVQLRFLLREVWYFHADLFVRG